MLKEISIVDEILGKGARNPQVGLNVPAEISKCSVGELIRFRVEQEFARDDDALGRLIGSRLATREAQLNPQATQDRHFFASQAQRRDAPSELYEAMLAEAIAAGQEAFAEGKYLLLVNDNQVTVLEEEVPLEEIDQVTFLRLMPLQGG